MWRAQIMPAIRGARLLGLLDGTDAAPDETLVITPADKDNPAKTAPNPAYDTWISRDQIVLAYLLQSLSSEVLPHVHRIEHAAGVWQAIEEMFASQSQAKVTNLRIALANTKKLNLSTAEFLTKMQGIADELAAASCPVTDKELISFILAGLGSGYDALVAAIGVVTTPMTLSMLYSQLHAYDERQEMLRGQSSGNFETSANAASRQRRPRYNYNNNKPRGDRGDRREDRRDDRRDDRPTRQGRGGGRAPPGGGRGRGRGRRRTSAWVDVICQICNKEGHAAKDCWWRFEDDDDDSYDDKEAHAASYGVDTNWYSDTGATDHITSELDKLTMKEKYHGRDKINAANGAG
jgi:hypothetical protein